MRWLSVALCALVLAAILTPSAPALAQAGERDFLESASAKLDSYAQACFDAGYPKRAREVWLEVIWDYLTDDDRARKANRCES